MKYDVNSFKDRFERWKNGESYWDLRNINLNNTTNIPSSISQDYITSYVDDYFKNYDNGKDNQLVEYIKAIENPNNVGYNPKTNTWKRVQMEGFDPNTYGYGLDHRYFDKSILNDDGSMDHDVMLDQVDKKLKYYEGAAKRNGVDKNRISNDDYLLSIGAMYRGDAKDVYNAVAKYNILKPGEFKKEIYNKYKRQGLNERIKQSEKFLKNKKQDNSFIKNYNLIDDLKKQNSFIPKFDKGKTGYVRQNNNPIMFDNQGNLVDQITGEKGTMLLPNVTIRPNRPREYSSAFDGSLQNFVDVTNALSGGILNRASATQNLRAVYDTYKYLKGDINKQDLINSVVYGNSGIVSDNYYDKYPIVSTLLNFAGDVAGGISTYKSASNLIKPRYNPEAYGGKSFVYRTPTPRLFVTPHANVKDLTDNIDLLQIAKNNTYGGTKIVDQYGNINFKTLRYYVDKLNNLITTNKLKNPSTIYNSRPLQTYYDKSGFTIPTIGKIDQNLYQHLIRSARSAMRSPTPKGFTKQQQVEAALLHDIGKITPDKDHANASIDVLRRLNYPIDDSVENAIKNHMADNMLDQDALTRSLRFSDVSHSVDPEVAFHIFPNLWYPRHVNNPVYYAGSNIKDQAKNINKIFRKLGYDKININSSPEQIGDQIADRIDQMRTFVRAIKHDDYKNIVENVPNEKASGQRAELFSVIYDPISKTYKHKARSNYSSKFGIDPDTRDGAYISVDPEFSDKYGTLSIVRRLPANGNSYRFTKPEDFTKKLMDNIIYPFHTSDYKYSNLNDYNIMYQAQTGSGITKAIQDYVQKHGYVPKNLNIFKSQKQYLDDLLNKRFAEISRHGKYENFLDHISNITKNYNVSKSYYNANLNDKDLIIRKNYIQYIIDLSNTLQKISNSKKIPQSQKGMIIVHHIKNTRNKIKSQPVDHDYSLRFTDQGKLYYKLLRDDYGILRAKMFKEKSLVPLHDLNSFVDNIMYIQHGGDKRLPPRGYMQGFKNQKLFDFVKDYEPDDADKLTKLKFNKGKNKPGYYQFMENLADKKAQEWTTVPFLPLNPNVVLTQMLNDNTYNYRQWYNNLPFGATVNDFGGHFPDTYKTVYHPTFSNESMYSPNNNQYVPNTQYNPNNITGGTWSGNNYILSKDQIDNNWDVDRTVDYLLKADPGVKLIIPQYNSGKGIHIKKENKGKFTAAANRHGMSVQAFARKVLNAPKGKYSPTLRKRANFAKNAAKWHK